MEKSSCFSWTHTINFILFFFEMVSQTFLYQPEEFGGGACCIDEVLQLQPRNLSRYLVADLHIYKLQIYKTAERCKEFSYVTFTFNHLTDVLCSDLQMKNIRNLTYKSRQYSWYQNATNYE